MSSNASTAAPNDPVPPPHEGSRVEPAYPQGLNNGWGDGNAPTVRRPDPDTDVRLTESLVEKLIRSEHADPKRVYVVGFSNGGSMALRMAAQRPRLVAAGGVAGAPATKKRGGLHPHRLGRPAGRRRGGSCSSYTAAATAGWARHGAPAPPSAHEQGSGRHRHHGRLSDRHALVMRRKPE
ncbi:prolyl oligopeptidase family serine peptidase [Streptomyces spiramyceticus]|uniref:prolyl oligopeptidase family serine peptidase n=1 Tax=Streptomyces spiramyceticus TaxID=299717 RepID=UPI00237AD7E3|nr:PHB depolymerase family esterase [Streptomyces spiramyceticus]